jgi:hypothetical protein
MTIGTHVSPIDAASRAFAQTKQALFPFRIERWLALGLVTFLDQCGRIGGGGFNGGLNTGSQQGDHGESFGQALDWVNAHVVLVVVLAALALVLIVGITALALWLNSRGTFMYIDNVATGRADVRRPWSEHGRHANSYFVWKFTIALLTLGAVILTLVPLALTLVSVARRGFGPGSIAALVGVTLVFLAIVVVAKLVSVTLRDFVAPVQLLRDVPCGTALQLVAPALRANLGTVLLYLVLKLVYALLLGMTVIALACVTCCLALCCLVLPIISQAILQPLFYFERAWSLQFAAAMGFDLMTSLASETAPRL